MRRRAKGEAFLSIAAVMLLVGILVAFDPRVREQVNTLVGRDGGRTAATAATATSVVTDMGSALVQAAKDQSIEHAPLLIFGAGAAVLVIFMLRM